MNNGSDLSEPVLDASALIAYLRGEAGSTVVDSVLPCAVMSTLNWSETLQKSLFHGVEMSGLFEALQRVGLSVLPFDAADAKDVAELWTLSRNLSLADRACLALGRRRHAPVLTTDRAWVGLDIGVEILLIR